jgi:hypothetical protein
MDELQGILEREVRQLTSRVLGQRAHAATDKLAQIEARGV